MNMRQNTTTLDDGSLLYQYRAGRYFYLTMHYRNDGYYQAELHPFGKLVVARTAGEAVKMLYQETVEVGAKELFKHFDFGPPRWFKMGNLKKNLLAVGRAVYDNLDSYGLPPELLGL